MTLIQVSGRAPLYMALITLCSAAASLTALWAGFVVFGFSALVLEMIIHALSQLNG